MRLRQDSLRASVPVGLALAAALAALPAWAASVCGAAPAGSDAVPVVAKTETTLDVDALCASISRLATPESNLHGVVVERRGRLLLEAYFDGMDNPGAAFFARSASFTADDLHDVRSVTKSVTAILFGIAIDRGLLPGADEPVLDAFPEYAHLRDTPKARITAAHLLGMSSGLDWDESGSYVRPGNTETRMRFASDPDRFVFERDLVGEPGARFNYNGGGTALVGEVVARAAGMPLERFAEEFLFGPLDIRHTEWRRDRKERVTPFGGLRLRPRDMARIGRLMLDRGRWNGRQVVSAAWVDEMVEPRLPAGGTLRYGRGWWLGEVAVNGSRHRYAAAFGNGGQRIYVVPALDLVVAVTAGQYNKDTSWQAPLRVLQEVVGATR